MVKSAFDKIKAGLDDAIAYAEGNTAGAVTHIPETVNVRAIRKHVGLKQEAFADRYGIGIHRLRDWEQGRSQPDSAARAYLKVIEVEPEAVGRALAASGQKKASS